MAKETPNKVLLVGVGLMGNTIAQSFAMAGIEVVLFNDVFNLVWSMKVVCIMDYAYLPIKNFKRVKLR